MLATLSCRLQGYSKNIFKKCDSVSTKVYGHEPLLVINQGRRLLSRISIPNTSEIHPLIYNRKIFFSALLLAFAWETLTELCRWPSLDVVVIAQFGGFFALTLDSGFNEGLQSRDVIKLFWTFIPTELESVTFSIILITRPFGF